MNYGRLAAIAVLLAAGAVMAPAHHSFALFDGTRAVTLTGTITEFRWTNPHCLIRMTVRDPKNGDPVHWLLEGAGPNVLVKKGWKKDSLRPGDAAGVTINPLRDGTPGGSFLRVTVNGVVLGAGEGY